MKKKYGFFLLFVWNIIFCQTTVTQQNTLILSNFNYGLTNPLWDVACPMTYNSSQIATKGAAFSFQFTNPGGAGYKGYPNGVVGGYSQGGTYYPGNTSASGFPIQIKNLNHDLRINWKVSQQNANDANDKWWASINVIFDNTGPTLEPVSANRDYDLVIMLNQYQQEDLNDVPRGTNQVYWYFARNTNGSLKTLDLLINGVVYKWAVRYKFFNYPVGDPNYDKNNKVHLKFIPVDNNNVAPFLDHSLKMFIDASKEYIQYLNLTPAELQLANTKVADPELWVKSVAAGYEVYTGSFTVNNDYFYTLKDYTAPASPTNLIGNYTAGTISLNWNSIPDTDLKCYKIYKSTNNNAYVLLADNVFQNNYIDTQINSSDVYKYYTVAVDRSYNVSNSSNIINLPNNNFTPYQMVNKMGTGINVGNVLSAPYEGNWAAAVTETYIDNIYRLNFKHIRLPIRFDNQTTPFSAVTYTNGSGNYIGSPSNYTVNTAYLDRIEQIVDWCLARNLVVILDVHGDSWIPGCFNPASSFYKTGNDRLAVIDRFKAIWRDVSVRFQTKSEDVLFEILNEPFFDMSAAEVIDLNTQILSVIRQTNPTRNVIVTGGGNNSYNAPMQLSDAFIQSDSHLIATFHYYQPFSFTSSASATYNDNNWGTVADVNTLRTNFTTVKNWSVSKNIPVYVGEFGADNVNGYNYFNQANGVNGGPDVDSRFNYYYQVAKISRELGFSLAPWDAGDKSGKTMYINYNESWVKDIRNGVLDSQCEQSGIIKNANIECNYDYNWTVTNKVGAISKINNTSPIEAYNNSVGLKLNVTQTTGSYNDVALSNVENFYDFTAGTTYTFSCKAKGLAGANSFKFRLKAVVGGVAQTAVSVAKTLTANYTDFSYDYAVPAGTTSLTLELLTGFTIGEYYFDEFQMNQKTTCTATTTWNGAVWSNGIPNSSTNAYFTGNFNSTSDLDACSVTVQNNANVVFLTGHTLNVMNQINVNSGSSLTVENNAAITQTNGSNNLGSFTVKRQSKPMIRLDYTAWSSPVSNQQLLAFSPQTLANRFYGYNYLGTTTATAFYSVNTSENFKTGEGCLIRVANNWSPTIYTPYLGVFSGDLNNGNVNIEVGNGYNLIGNPYASPINASVFLNQNTSVNGVYFWTHTIPATSGVYPVNNYASYSLLGGVAAAAGGEIPNGKIQTGQGFFVNSTKATLSFRNSQRIKASQSTQFFRQVTNDGDISRLRLNLNSQTKLYNQILIGYTSNASESIDKMIDVAIFDENSTSIYSTIENNKLVINGDHPSNIDKKVLLGFNSLQADNYFIEIENLEGSFQNSKIYLLDKYLNKKHCLNDSKYEFASQEGRFDDRFELRYELNKNLKDINNNSYCYTNQNNELVVANLNNEIKSIHVFDISGKIIFSKDTINMNEFKVNMAKQNKWLLIDIQLNNGETNSIKYIY